MNKTGIEYLDYTLNPITGCSPVSSGCQNYWAKAMHSRKLWGDRPFSEVTWHPSRLEQPIRVKKPARIGVCFMSDLFHEQVPDEFLREIFAMFQQAHQHTFLVLTKRPIRMKAKIEAYRAEGDTLCTPAAYEFPNVWWGVSVENQATADDRIPLLLQTPAARRYVSVEPMLGPIKLSRLHAWCPRHDFAGGFCSSLCPDLRIPEWVICGGESGPNARPCNTSWIRSIVQQCRAASIPCFVKQLGAHVVDRNDAGFDGDEPCSWPMDTKIEDLTGLGWQGDLVRIRLRNCSGGNPDEWPDDLMVRQFPEAKA
jgi:protein gp37